MVVVKVRETYDLHTIKNKMSVIAIHTPNPTIIKANFPGLLMQCKAYRPLSCNVRIACASVLPMDPLNVGTAEGDVAPEDLFNPILYKAMTNIGMSQIEARIFALGQGVVGSGSAADVEGNTAVVDVNSITDKVDEFDVYYGLLANAHGWKHANPQSGLEMSGLKPLVFEMLYNVGDQRHAYAFGTGNNSVQRGDLAYPGVAGGQSALIPNGIRGNARPLPFINTTSFTGRVSGAGNGTPQAPGFQEYTGTEEPYTPLLPENMEQDVPWINCVVAGIIIPPSRLHELYYRMVVEWNIEFTQIRPLAEVTDWNGLESLASLTHYKNYDYTLQKTALTGIEETILENDSCMVSTNADIEKVM